MSRLKVPHLNTESRSVVLKRILVAYLASYQVAGLLAFVIGIVLFIKLCPWFKELMPYSAPTILLWMSGLAIFASCVMALLNLLKYHEKDRFHLFLLAFASVAITLTISAIVAHINQNYVDDGSFLQDMRRKFSEKATSVDQDIGFWEYYQENNKCCGLEDFSDWIGENKRGDVISKETSEKALKTCSCRSTHSKKQENLCQNITETARNFSLTLDNALIFSVPCLNVLINEISLVCLSIRILAPVLVVSQLVIISCTSLILWRIQKSSVIENYKVKYDATSDSQNNCPIDVFQITPR